VDCPSEQEFDDCLIHIRKKGMFTKDKRKNKCSKFASKNYYKMIRILGLEILGYVLGFMIYGLGFMVYRLRFIGFSV